MFTLVFVIILFAGISINITPVTCSEFTYPHGMLPCKLHNYTNMDCSSRQLTTIPTFNDDAIKSLDLSHNKLGSIAGYVPFTHLTSLRNLYLSNSSTTNIDDGAFVGLKSLIMLDMSGHEIESIHGRPFLPLESLQRLDLSHGADNVFNSLRNLSSTVFDGLTNLKWLDLHGNAITTLPDRFFHDLHNLIYLDLSQNNFYASPFSLNALTNLRSLQNLNISRTGLKVLSFGSNFPNLTHLQELNMIYNMYDLVGDTFQFFSSLHIQSLSVDITAVVNATHVFKPFRRITHLSAILKCAVVPSLVDILTIITSLESPLQHLTISEISFNTVFDSSTFQPLQKWNSTLTNLEVTNSRSCFIAPLQIIENNTFSGFPNIVTLNLSYNGLDQFSDGAFNGLNMLLELDLSNNLITTVPKKAFEVFTQSGSLLFLDLSYNNLNVPSLDIVESLTFLNLAGNPLNWIYCHDCNQTSHIKVLNLENLEVQKLDGMEDYRFAIDLFDSPFMLFLLELTAANYKIVDSKKAYIYLKNLCHSAPSLEHIELPKWYLYFSISYSLGTKCLSLTYFDISGSNLFDKENTPQQSVYLPSLDTLQLASNNIHYIDEIAFINAPSLRSLDLSYNLISFIDDQNANLLKNLTYLNLANNQIISLHWLSSLHNIASLNIALNNVAEIPKTFLIQTNHLTTFDASGNPFDCSACLVHQFKSWIVHDRFTWLQPNSMYQCRTPNRPSLTSVNTKLCPFLVYIYMGASVFGVMIIAAVIMVIVHYRWHIKYKLFLLFHRRNYQRIMDNNDREEECANGIERPSDAYIVYASENEAWVKDELEVNIENGPEPFELCMNERGDTPPGYFLNSICHGIMQSRRTIAVLSKDFMANEMCHFQLQIARMRLIKEGRDVLILVFLENIPDKEKTMLLRQILCNNEAVLQWPQDNLGRNLFWCRLREELKKPVIVNRRYEV